MSKYTTRDEYLKLLGFRSYADYLNSPLWKKIRKRVLRRSKHRCEVCGGVAKQVHHRSYTNQTLLGRRDDFLVAVCGDCHVAAEFDGDRKVSLSEANSRMNAAAKANGRRLTGLCGICRKNPTKKNKTICGQCRADQKKAESETNVRTALVEAISVMQAINDSRQMIGEGCVWCGEVDGHDHECRLGKAVDFGTTAMSGKQ